MSQGFQSTLFLTILLAIGLVFFLRAASKDRTTMVEIKSPKPALEVLEGISKWLEQRGWRTDGGDAGKNILRFRGNVSSSPILAVLLSILGTAGAFSLGLVIKQLIPELHWWPLVFGLVGPSAGIIYKRRAERIEELELCLLDNDQNSGSIISLKAHRDELIAIEVELASTLQLSSDGSLLSSPI